MSELEEGFNPKMKIYVRNWSGYAGADFADVTGMSYPSTVHIIRIVRSIRVDSLFSQMLS